MNPHPTDSRTGLRCSLTTAFVLLTLCHFTVDFYGGLLTPLLEPTLTGHLGRDIGFVAALIGGWAFLVNVVQPLSGWLLPKRGMPGLLLAAPLAAAASALLGLSNRIPVEIVLLTISGMGIGLLHPEATLAVHSLNARRAGAAVGLFMAAGYFGFAIGGMVSGIWAEVRGLRGFWLWALPAGALAIAVAAAGLHRLQGHAESGGSSDEPESGLTTVLLLSTGIATVMCLVARFIAVLLVRRFPEGAGQGWGGATVFATGITGAAGAFFWGMQADRRGPARILAGLQLAAIPFLLLLLHTRRIEWAPVWGLCLGATLGSSFPLIVVRSRRTRGFSPRLRMGLTIGGAWGIGELVFIAAGRYLNRFPVEATRPVEQVFLFCAALLLVNALLAWRLGAPATGETNDRD